MSNFSVAQWLFLALVFVVVSGVPMGGYFILRRGVVHDRLTRVVNSSANLEAPKAASKWIESVVNAARPLAQLSLPDAGWEDSEFRRRFVQAGLRRPEAPVIFLAVKSIIAFGLPLCLWLIRVFSDNNMPANQFFIMLGFLCALGYYLPNFLLNKLIAARKLEIFENFPDALDLLTICVEAGLSLEAALNRVASEIAINSRILAEELELVCLEFRAGSGKERALRNLALRTGVDDIDTLVAMLIQSEKFGTSIGESLRIHSEMLRVKRQQRAEECAAKVAVKLIFPLVLCIFPSILIVVAGPAMIRIVKVLPTIVGAG
ncbi:MAG: type II secretion system F family protein [Bacteroidota bacterium]